MFIFHYSQWGNILVQLLSLKAIIREAENLVTLPDILLRLRNIIDDPHTSADDISNLISLDPSLSAKVLKLVNSSLYYLPRTISSVSQAITLIGTKQLYALVTAASAAAIIQSAAGKHVDMQVLWKHAMYTACGNTILSEELRENADDFFISGLLCNMGTLAVVNYAPDIAIGAVGTHNTDRFPWEMEMEVLGFTMAEAGGALLNAWRLPFSVTTPVLFQHTPDQAKEYLTGCHAQHVSTRIALEILQPENQGSLDYRSTISESSLTATGYQRKGLDSLIEKILERSPEMFDIFTI